jgi:hypothetical protein
LQPICDGLTLLRYGAEVVRIDLDVDDHNPILAPIRQRHKAAGLSPP